MSNNGNYFFIFFILAKANFVVNMLCKQKYALLNITFKMNLPITT